MDETEAFFDKSNKKLILAKTAYSMDDYSDAVSLSYYAMFLVAKALILKKGIKAPKTHAGLIHLFNSHYVKEDEFSYEKYKFLASTQSQRENADYDAIDEIDERIARKRIKQAEEFIKEAEKFI
ncbi:MAG: HEPN domain-containing protein [Methanobrevibacter sp.]|uniref:HEPN domain-containing protein n=1 Tax=Methanobrevibacter sp. TaxID=66852 RepID=UPI00260116E1|nr:HEPN domain-containing protein [Methanobrevibacter sp.]MBQ8018760.1 HEPN domain-containing protein [Methanobrevibacter sp.]MBR1610243.1 HEPN domain-containing protein [Methanobrevibacter sp.]